MAFGQDDEKKWYANSLADSMKHNAGQPTPERLSQIRASAQANTINGWQYDPSRGTWINGGLQKTNEQIAQLYPTEYTAWNSNRAATAANTQWASTYEPMWNEYGADMQRQMQTAFDRSYADARGRLGYGLAMGGSGEGGLAEAARMQLTTEAQNKRMDIAATRDTMLQQAYIQFMTTKDAQAFELAKMAANYEYNRQIAEMNQPSFWDSLGPIVGMGLAMFGGPLGAAIGIGASSGAIVSGIGNQSLSGGL